MNHRLAVPVFALLLAAGAASSSAQNLLANPNFDVSLGGWQTGGSGSVSVTWDGTRDAEGSPHSGSAKGLVQAPVVNGISGIVSQCVALAPGVSYVFGGKIFIPEGQAVSGSAFFIAIPFGTPDCSGPPPPSAFIPTPAVTGVGHWIESTGTTGGAASVLFGAYLAPDSGGAFQANFDDLVVQPGAPRCQADGQTLCVGAGRFQVTATFDAGGGRSGRAHTQPASGDGGLLWFFSFTNTEVVVKVLDGCADGGHFWFFAAGLTNVQVTIAVTDTVNGATKIYVNPLGRPFAPIQDTSAFACTS
jgi:hypothetical protein